VKVPGQDTISGFFIVVGVMVAILAGLVLLFRRRGWL
jgi:LPXTG-motif cell wall-anchored protein